MKKMFAIISSVAIVVAIVGCENKSGPSSTGGNSGGAEEGVAEHGHGAGPHGGTILEWGGGAYHVEFTVDHDAKSATVYILGGDAKTPAPLKTDKLTLTINEPAFQLELSAQPLDGEAGEMASRFAGTHDNLGVVREFAGTISGDVDGTPYAVDFAEEAGEHGHDD